MKPSTNHKTWPTTSLISESGWTILIRIIVDLIDLRGIEKGGRYKTQNRALFPGMVVVEFYRAKKNIKIWGRYKYPLNWYGLFSTKIGRFFRLANDHKEVANT